MAEENDKNAFKLAQSKYRRRGDDPTHVCLDDLIDFSSCRDEDPRVIPLKLPDDSSDVSQVYRGSIFGLKEFQGFMYAPQALSPSLQLELAYLAVSEYCESPHRTNIDLCPPKKNEIPNCDDKMWDIWKEEYKLRDAAKKRKPDPNNKRKYRSFKKLSWSTMGYHYDWTRRMYHEGCKSDMPSLVEELAIQFARTSLLLEPNSNSLAFTPSASIVNYYNQKSNMGGHRDDLELAMDKPIVSMSVGLPAIFLLGGKTKGDEPVVPILIRPGDVMCMGGDSRLNFHGMARLLPATVSLPNTEARLLFPSLDDQVTLDGSSHVPANDQGALEEYLSQHRININVRQVYPDAG